VVDEEGQTTLEPEQPGPSRPSCGRDRACAGPGLCPADVPRSLLPDASVPFCGGPLDPTGHICPRANGYKR